MKNETISGIIGITVGVCLIAAFFVSSAAVFLKPKQDLNKKLEKINKIVELAELSNNDESSLKAYQQKIEAFIINLETGTAIDSQKYQKGFTPEDFDLKMVSNKRGFFQPIKTSQDIAGIKKLPRYMPVYLVKENGLIKKVILLIYGKGLWSTLYGFLALESDLKTISGITFYEHGETPGLGGEVDNQRWKQSWKGKIAFSDQQEVLLEVIKGTVNQNDRRAKHQIDGLSGATLTTRGINNLVRFWLSDKGYGIFLKKIGAGQ